MQIRKTVFLKSVFLIIKFYAKSPETAADPGLFLLFLSSISQSTRAV